MGPHHWAGPGRRSPSNDADLHVAYVRSSGFGRKWIGIDITHLAIGHVRKRLYETMGTDLSPIEVHGIPSDPESARALALENKYKFQQWAVWAVGAKPARDKQGADRGVDGYIFFRDDESGKYRKVVVQVKGGENVGVKDVRDLIGTASNERAEISVLVTLKPPTAAMKGAAAEAGAYSSPSFQKKFQRVQIVTVADIFDKHLPVYPQLDPSATMKKAVTRGRQVDQPGLF